MGSGGQAKVIVWPMGLKYEMTLDQIWADALMDNVQYPHGGLTRLKLSLRVLKANLMVKTPDGQLTATSTEDEKVSPGVTIPQKNFRFRGMLSGWASYAS